MYVEYIITTFINYFQLLPIHFTIKFEIFFILEIISRTSNTRACKFEDSLILELENVVQGLVHYICHI